MKKTSAILLTIMVLAAFVRGQTRADNPKRPLNKNAGRVINLDEMLRIRDDGNTAVFRNLQWLSLGKDGSLFFLDFAEGTSLYRYGPDGSLIFKALKSGQGPGECKYPSGYFFTGETIRVPAWIPPKIMDFGIDGRYIRETKIEQDMHGLWFLAAADGKIYGIRDELFSSAAFRSAGVFSIPNSVYEISPDFRTWKKLYEFPVRMAVKRARAIRLDMIDAAIRGSTLYILHTAEYRVVKFDLRTAQVERIITRVYDRVKGVPAKGTDPDPEARGIEAPSDPYMFDINEIHAVGENLWVLTSVIRPDGDDQQVDVFDAAGRFIDSFFLHFPASGRNHRIARRKTLITDDGYLFVPEQEEDGLVTIGKYKIRDLVLERK
ncbi:MAG: hypothetical protein IMZ50_05360 [Candidatus Atribacteria bacterium]|nr:hypothetical protein [Candidatus Atribacteria bacterium]